MGSGRISHGDLFPDDDDKGKEIHDVDEFLSQVEQVMQNMNKSREKIVEESEHLRNIKEEIDEMKENPIDDSSAYVLALDEEHEKKPTFFYANDPDEEELEYLVKSLLDQMPKATVIDILHEKFHDFNIEEEDLHDSIIWATNKAKKYMKGMNPATLQALNSQHRQN